MRIALVHSFYRSATPSGENEVVLRQAQALQDAGNEVIIISRHSDAESRKAGYRISSAVRVITGRGESPLAELDSFDPDVVHIHNLFPNFGTSWMKAASVPLVATVHNFRSVCANGLLFRMGSFCDECPTRDRWAGVKHGCYHGSRVETLPITLGNLGGASRDPVLNLSTAAITLNSRAADLLVSYGASRQKIHVIPNGIDIPGVPGDCTQGGRWIAIGRLTAEKGFRQLVEMWPSSEKLDIVGDGPEAEAIRAIAPSNVQMLGQLPRAQVRTLLPNYLGAIVPSICLEMQPSTALEAMAAGTPVIARVTNVAADLVTRHKCGAVYSTSTELAAALTAVANERDRLSENAREAILLDFSESRWIERLTTLYHEVAR